jgi:cytochrome c oxidase cbb3-type subunit 3
MSLLFRNSVVLLGTLLALASCDREKRDTHGPKPDKKVEAGVSPTTFAAGGDPQPVIKDANADKYEKNAFLIGEGKRYYEWYNCYGCHAAGGGDIGPALMDDKWIYGGEIEQIHASIAEGRPNGMPSFRKLIPDEQIWEISAYVRAMGGNVPPDVPPSRGDELQHGTPLTQVPSTPPQPEAPPKGPR